MSNQDNFVYSHLAGVDSTAIATVAYNENTLKLFIRFKAGSEIVYTGVPFAEYEALRKSKSVGAYYAYNIKGVYPGDPQHNTRLRVTEAKAAKPVVTNVTKATHATVKTAPGFTTPAGNSEFSIKWTSPEFPAGGEPRYKADSLDDALKQFNEEIQPIINLGVVKTYKVVSATQYFE